MTDTQQEWPPKGVKWYYSDDYVCIANADCREIGARRMSQEVLAL
jgi:hypothetical protein